MAGALWQGVPDTRRTRFSESMQASQFDFDLPEGLIALRPAVPRDSARLMVVRAGQPIRHAHVRDLPDFLAAGDRMVVNQTRVLPARLKGVREGREGGPEARIEILLHRRLGPDAYSALARPARKLVAGDRLRFGALGGRVLDRGEGGEVRIAFDVAGAALDAAIAATGEMPLPPYIAGKRAVDARDADDYQTLFASQTGSVAAPTAGLHFTPELLARLEAAGVTREQVTLHVGLGTFLPVTVEDLSQHRMHAEFASLDGATAARLNAARVAGGRILAVGTTSLRTLESATDAAGRLAAFEGDTDIFITPGTPVRAADMLLTNFHLPRSTLFMLVSAFMGLDVMRAAYAEAIREGYRFYSYGDACLLIRPS
jgi:S-adenosylmethionine:tRNA ribosyltransferase-isomerase